MKNLAGSLILVTLLLDFTFANAQSLRETVPFGNSWTFSSGSASKITSDSQSYTRPDFDDAAWRKISLPHDFVVDTPYEENSNLKCIGWDYFYQSVGWYRKHFTLSADEAGRRIQLVLEGVNERCTVYCNGLCAGHGREDCGVSVFELTDFVREGDNLLCAMVNATDLAPSEKGGAGLCGNASILKTASFSVAPYGIHTSYTFTGSTAEITVETVVDSVEPEEEDYASVKHFLLDMTGQIVAESQVSLEYLLPYTSGTLSHKLSVPYAARWDQNVPYRYTLKTLVIRGGQIVDEVLTPISLRELEYDPASGTALLNGRSHEMRMKDISQSFPSTGRGVPDGYWRYILEKAKAEGFNVIRLKDPTPSLLDICDDMGVFVVEECSSPEISVPMDRVHPCIAAWQAGEGVSAKRAVAAFRRLDPSRPLLSGDVKANATESTEKMDKNKHEAVEVSLSANKSQLVADGQDIIVVDVSIVDKKGEVVTENDRILYVYVDTALNTAYGISAEDQKAAGIEYKLSPMTILGFSNDDPAFKETVRDYIAKTVLQIRTYRGRAQVLFRSEEGSTDHAHIRVGGSGIMGRTLTFDYTD